MGQVDRYTVLAEIGRGRFGTVYLGHDVELDRPVALKALAAEFVADPAELAGFRAEATVLATLAHPNVVRIFDLLEGDGAAWIVEEYIDGASLRKVIEAADRLTPEQALGVVRGALIGLQFVHEAAVLHRDIQPANLLADRDGSTRLVDFGQAGSVLDRPARPTGSPAYVAPEVISQGAVDVRADVYSAGCVLFELLTGNPPFAAESVAATLRQHLKASRPRPAGVAPATAAVVRRSMARDPGGRPQSAAEMLAELEEAARDDYGPDWLSRASIVALVGAAAGAAAVGSAVVGTAATVHATSTLGTASVGSTTVGTGAVGGTTVAAVAAAPRGGAPGGTPPGARGTQPTSAKGVARRVRPIARTSRVVVAALVAVGIMVGAAGGLAATHSGPFRPWYAPALAASSCPAGPAVPAGGASQVTCSRVLTESPGEAIQVTELHSPTTVPLAFGFCSGFTCGDADPECLSNLYIPQFGASVLSAVTLMVPPRASASEVTVAAKRGGQFQPISTPAVTTAGNQVTVKVNTPLADVMRPHFKPGRGYCGFNDAQVKAFRSRFGKAYDNSEFAVLRVLARWHYSGAVPSPGPVKVS